MSAKAINARAGDKIEWCYLGKYEKLPEEYKKLIHKQIHKAILVQKTLIQALLIKITEKVRAAVV
jgi:TRAP-type C4-dicarboxylate transport system substrate-binding protein